MAGGQERALRRRIRSVQSTRKITRAMELIAASRIVKAQQRVAAARPYAELITDVTRNLSAAGAGANQPLLTPREQVSTVGFVVVTADRGLAGGYNSAVIRLAEDSLKSAQAEGKGYRLFVCGRKGVGYFRFRGYEVTAAFPGFSENPTYEDARAVAEVVVPLYDAGEVDRVDLAYTQFLSLASQKPTIRRFIPLDAPSAPSAPPAPGASGSPGDRTGAAGTGGGSAERPGADAPGGGPSAQYEFEPGPEEILARLLPRYVESRLFAAFLDAAASEQAARQRAMKSATDNAGDLIKRYERMMNRARQDAITTEIIEIASGAEALSQDSGSDREPLLDQLGFDIGAALSDTVVGGDIP